jgi:hypothetical protein
LADGLSPILYWKDTLDMFQEFLRVLFSACVLLGGLDKFLQSEETADFIYKHRPELLVMSRKKVSIADWITATTFAVAH